MIIVGLLDLDIVVYKCAMSCKEDTTFSTVKETVDLFILDWLTKAKCTHYIGFLTDSDSNFRNKIATTWKYKGHRPKEKPRYYKEIREYIISHWKGQLMIGIEADDALAITATKLNKDGICCVIITEDKDLLQVPGLHYNIHKMKKVFKITESQAQRNLWCQVITGDRTDNIPGVSHAITETSTGSYNSRIRSMDIPLQEKQKLLFRYPAMELYGQASANKYLDSFNNIEWPMRVLELYIDKYEDSEVDIGYGDLRFYETFSLIFMLRECPEGIEIDYTPLETPVDEEVLKAFDIIVT